jgi:RND family efflux transporter MFP subunit
MITLIIAIWMGFLWLLVKVGILKKWHLWMKISPVVVWAAAQAIIFLPLSWTAPVGPVSVVVSSVQVRPSVTGPVIEVPVASWTPLKTGDVLFKVDPEPYAANVRQAEARLKLAEEQLTRKRQLFARQAVAEAETEAAEAEVEMARAQMNLAKIDLENTTVRAPMDGIVPSVVLLPGNRVAAGQDVMAVLDVDRPIVAMIVKQNAIRHVRPGQPAEVVFRSLPGQTFAASVSKLYQSAPHAEFNTSGKTPDVPEIRDTTYAVELSVDLQGEALTPGVSGQAAIMTDKVGSLGVIRQITLRMTTWMNFL